MTEKLYYKDSHIHEFEAVVLKCRKEKNAYGLILDKTAFFPEGGGQKADTGYVGEVRIKDVQEKDGEIIHYCDTPLEEGKCYSCKIDYEQRRRRMQNHSGEHIVSGITHRLFGYNNVGFHMGDDCMTIDFDGELSKEQLSEIEKLANESVRENLPVKAWIPESQELAEIDYRSKLELSHDVRIVKIAEADCCACCAPHVKNTGEIGIIKILEAERHRGGMRISLVCGMDALENYSRVHENNTQISMLLSSKREDTPKAVERVLNEQTALKERVAELSMELIKLKAEKYEYTEGNICVFDNVLDEVALRELVNLLMEKCGGIAAAFSGSDEKGYRYIIGSRNVDLRKNAALINSGISGRGGGKQSMIQGSATEKAKNIQNYINSLFI